MNLALIRRKRRKEKRGTRRMVFRKKEMMKDRKEYFYRKVDWTLAGLLKS